MTLDLPSSHSYVRRWNQKPVCHLAKIAWTQDVGVFEAIEECGNHPGRVQGRFSFGEGVWGRGLSGNLDPACLVFETLPMRRWVAAARLNVLRQPSSAIFSTNLWQNVRCQVASISSTIPRHYSLALTYTRYACCQRVNGNSLLWWRNVYVCGYTFQYLLFKRKR